MRVVASGDKKRQVVSGVRSTGGEERGYMKREGTKRMTAPGDKRRHVASGCIIRGEKRRDNESYCTYHESLPPSPAGFLRWPVH